MMKIGLIQYDVQWLDRKENFSKINAILNQCNEIPDLFILPEMFDTGYIMSPSNLSPLHHHKTIDFLKAVSIKYKTAFAGSIPYEVDGHYYNQFIIVENGTILNTYNKVHLFSLAGEDKEYTSGNRFSTCEIAGHKIKTLVCYDLRFPYASFNSENTDVLIYVANWPISRINHWNALLKARAIENQCYVIGVNRIGFDGNKLEYNGQSQIIDYNGDIILNAGNKEGLFFQFLDFNKQEIYREKLPFLKDQIDGFQK